MVHTSIGPTVLQGVIPSVQTAPSGRPGCCPPPSPGSVPQSSTVVVESCPIPVVLQSRTVGAAHHGTAHTAAWSDDDVFVVCSVNGR